jgi:hypothetical protein
MPQGFNLNRFKGKLGLEGARPTLFEANIFGGGVSPDFTFHCKAAQLPGKTLGIIEVPYFGRKIKVHGDLTFAEWTVTVLNEENFNVRNSFEQWMQGVNSHGGNLKTDPAYKSVNATVQQFSKTGQSVKKYTLEGVWCSDISAIDVAWDSNDQIEEFTATLQYDLWTSGSVV